MGRDRRARRLAGRTAAPAGPPEKPAVETLTVKMRAELYRRWNAYTAMQGTTAGRGAVALIERETAGWYTARRGEEPAAGPGEGEGPRVRYVG